MRSLSRFAAGAILLAFTTGPALADVPAAMNVQGLLTDSAGSPLPSAATQFEFSIWDSESGGTQVWPVGMTESQVLATDAAGRWNAHIGSVFPLTESVFSDSARWLQISVDNGGGPVTLPRVKLNSGPYSYRAGWSQKADTAYAIVGGGDGPYLPLAGGTMTGPISSVGAPSITMGKGNFGNANTNTGVNAFVAGQDNAATGGASTVAGGADNSADGDIAFIGSGQGNVAAGVASAIAGGAGNQASDTGAFIGAGFFNRAHGAFSVVGGGGGHNPADSNSALGDWSAIGGGQRNTASDIYTTVAGGSLNRADNWNATVGGGYQNVADGLMATVGGGSSNSAIGDYATVAGGVANNAQTFAATVGGGNDNDATAAAATIAGGQYNIASAFYATIAGGGDNKARGIYSVVAGGGGQGADSNAALGNWSVVGGGQGNLSAGARSAVVGGASNTASAGSTFIGSGANNETSGDFASVVGGAFNVASGNSAFIGGGGGNQATGLRATIAGGIDNRVSGDHSFIGGGSANAVRGNYSVIGGGGGGAFPDSNSATGNWATVPGGRGNVAGHYSFAAGRRAKATTIGSFVWADSVNQDFSSSYNNEFAIRAQNGVRAWSDNGNYGMDIYNGGNGDGVRAAANTSQGINWAALYATNMGTSPAVYAWSSVGPAAYLAGNVTVTGTLTKGGGAFKIDHPLDPANKYLFHSFVESPDMKNIYDGVVTLDADGSAWINLPSWFEPLNRDFRYQLTCIGGYAPVYVAEEIAGNRFRIAGGAPGLKVSWMVTGIRQDPYANANRIPVEEFKAADERGRYVHPEAIGKDRAEGLTGVAKDVGEARR